MAARPPPAADAGRAPPAVLARASKLRRQPQVDVPDDDTRAADDWMDVSMDAPDAANGPVAAA